MPDPAKNAYHYYHAALNTPDAPAFELLPVRGLETEVRHLQATIAELTRKKTRRKPMVKGDSG